MPNTALRAFIADTWDALQRIGLATADRAPETLSSRLRPLPATVAAASDFVQENAPENLVLKQDIYAEIEEAAPATLVIGSSTGGIPPSNCSRRCAIPNG